MGGMLSVEELTARLVAYNTVSKANEGTQSTRPIADFMSGMLEQGGFQVRQFPYWTNGVEKVNIVALKGGDEPHLAFSGHMDVVPVGEWDPTDDPFRLTRIGDKYYGRGVADMKLFLAIALLAGSRVYADELRRPFAIYLTSDEEIGCLGVRLLLKVKPQKRGIPRSEFQVKTGQHSPVPIPPYVVIGEPTELVPVYAHKGYMFLRIKIESEDEEAGHSSDPASGHSVVKTGLAEVLQILQELEERLQFVTDNRFQIGFPTINPGVVSMGAGAAKNILATSCSIDLEVRPLPGQSYDDLYDTIRDAVALSVRDLKGIGAQVNFMRSPTPAMETSMASPIVQLVAEFSGKKPATVSYNTEGGTFNAQGAQCVIWGPGSIAQAHKTDEYAEARWFSDEVVDLYAAVIKRMCG